MSEQSVIAFVKQVSRESALQQQVEALPGDVGGLVQLASAAGFNFSAEEWKAVAASSFGELSEGDLDSMAGGAMGQIDPCWRPISFQVSIFTRFG